MDDRGRKSGAILSAFVLGSPRREQGQMSVALARAAGC